MLTHPNNQDPVPVVIVGGVPSTLQRIMTSAMRRASAFTVSTGTSHRLLVGGGVGSSPGQHDLSPPLSPLEPPPLPPKRSSSLLGATTLFRPKLRDKSALNPKRVSVATSTFWEGHPELGHFVSNWETDTTQQRERLNSDASVWGTTERGGTESVNIWGDPPAVKKGVLLQQREKLLARWKERYCILTRDYLHCFRRTTSIHRSGVRLSEMGNFIFKMRLADVDEIEWETRRGVNVIGLGLPQEPKIFLKVPGEDTEGLRQWFTLLQECIYTSKERRQALRTMHSTTSRSLSSKSEGSPITTSSSSSDIDKDSVALRRNIAKISLNMNKTEGKGYSPLTEKRGDFYEEDSKVKVTLRRDLKKTTTAEEFMKGTKTDRNMCRATIMGNGYALPIDTTTLTRSNRPDSWTPQQIIYRTPIWLNNKMDERSTLNPEFSPSRHTSEIAFRKMC